MPTVENIPPHFRGKSYTHSREIGSESHEFSDILTPYNDLVREGLTDTESVPDSGLTHNHLRVFTQQTGPFVQYERRVEPHATRINTMVETTRWTLNIPWFGWLFYPLIKHHITHRHHKKKHPWWAPPQTFSAREVFVLALLATVSMSAAFINTLFTQTVSYAADEFNVDTQGQGIAGAIVRLGIVLAIPLAILGDRIGRRRVVVLLAFVAPAMASLGALAPNFGVLVATQSIARPIGLALDVAILVIVIEEMPKHGRAYGLSILALASGLGAGFAVLTLPVADIGTSGWRIVYVVALVWLIVAFDVKRHLTETARFRTHETTKKSIGVARHRVASRTLLMVCSVAFLANVFVATASIFQNRYLKDIHGYSAAMVALFTLSTATPAGVGLILGGKLAEIHGRRRVAAFSIPVGALLLAFSFVTSSFAMWSSAIVGGIIAAVAYPAMAVYRGELFPTGSRTTSSFLITVSALVGGSIGLVIGGSLIDSGWSYGAVMMTFASLSLVVSLLVFSFYPETAQKELEELNPNDAPT